MAKTKQELLDDAAAAGVLPPGEDPEVHTVAELETLLDPDRPAWEGSLSSSEPLVAPDGHVALSQADIDARA